MKVFDTILTIVGCAICIMFIIEVLQKRTIHFNNARKYTNKQRVEDVYKKIKNELKVSGNRDGVHYRNMIILALILITVPVLVDVFVLPKFHVYFSWSTIIAGILCLIGVIIVVVSGVKFGFSKFSNNIASFEVKAIDPTLNIIEEIDDTPLSWLYPFINSSFLKTTCKFYYNNYPVFAGMTCTQYRSYREIIDFNGFIIKSNNTISNGTINITNVSNR